MSHFEKTRVSEKKFYNIEDRLFTADGTVDGLITVYSTYGYKVGQVIICSSLTQQPRRLKIKRIVSEIKMYVGEEKTRINEYSDISDLLTQDNAKVSFVEQQRSQIDYYEMMRQIYEEEPTVALRTHAVDWLGRSYGEDNPLEVRISDGNIFSAMQLDAFGRLRVSNPVTLFDSQFRYQDSAKSTEYISGTASSTHDPNSSSILMTVGSQNNNKIYRESSKIFAYQPGKSLQILQTFCMGSANKNVRHRIGYFDVANGIYLERDNQVVNLVLRSSSTGNLTERRIPQSLWNIDTIPELDLSRVQIFFIDIEWLGVGSVRCGFIIDGKYRHVHTFHNANTETSPNTPLSTTYMGTACLPLRSELETTGSTSGSNTFRIICASVISEGGYTLSGRPRAVGHAIQSPYAIALSNTVYPIFSMRLKTTRLGGLVIPKSYSIAVSGNVNYRYAIIVGGTTSGGTWLDAGATDSSVQYNLTATSITGGSTIEQGYIINSNQASGGPSQAETLFRYQLERNTFTSTAIEFTIVLVASGTNNSAWAEINWEEIT